MLHVAVKKAMFARPACRRLILKVYGGAPRAGSCAITLGHLGGRKPSKYQPGLSPKLTQSAGETMVVVLLG